MQLIDFDDKIYFQRSIERRSKNSSLFFPLPIFQNPFLKGIIPGNESRGLLVPPKEEKNIPKRDFVDTRRKEGNFQRERDTTRVERARLIN